VSGPVIPFCGIHVGPSREEDTVTDNSNTRMNRLTLSFSGDLEEQFSEDYYQKSVKQIRFALLLGVFLYAIFALLDPLIVPEAKNTIFFVRYAIVCPSLLFGYLLTFTRYFRRAMQLILSLYLLIGGFGVIAMIAIANPPGSYLYYAGLILCIMFAYTFIRLRFWYATITSFIIAVAYEIVAIWFSNTSTPILMNNNFFLFAANIVGMSAGYSMEFYIRKNFLQKRTIETRTKELQKKNDELINMNKELAQSREEILRSAKRTELVFAALSEALPGTVLDDKYELEKKIGSGGFGTVYRAMHLLLQHPVAVKVFRPSIGTDPVKNLERFRIEGISASRVRHPNAISVLDFGVSGASIAYMVMELLNGWSLKDELDQKYTLSVSRCINILIPVCSALAEAHAMGIIHRDIKPSNIFLHQPKEGELVKVVDFGLAKLVSDTLNPEFQSLTETGSLLGTPVYMSPERLSNKPYDGQADMYSLGVMMYEMLCGRLPFQSSKDNYWSIVLMHMTHTPTLPGKMNPEISEKLESVMMRCLAKNPRERPTAKELEEALKEFASSEDKQSTALSPISFQKHKEPNTAIRRAARTNKEQVVRHTIQGTIFDEAVVLKSNAELQESQSNRDSDKDGAVITPQKRA
jgi:serine/threonine protein kinase